MTTLSNGLDCTEDPCPHLLPPAVPQEVWDALDRYQEATEGLTGSGAFHFGEPFRMVKGLR